MVVSFLPAPTACTFGLGAFEQSLVVTFVFVGMFFGSVFFGTFDARKHARSALARRPLRHLTLRTLLNTRQAGSPTTGVVVESTSSAA